MFAALKIQSACVENKELSGLLILESILGVCVIHRLTSPAIFPCQPESSEPCEDPQTEKSLEDVVDEHSRPALVCRPVFH